MTMTEIYKHKKDVSHNAEFFNYNCAGFILLDKGLDIFSRQPIIKLGCRNFKKEVVKEIWAYPEDYYLKEVKE